MERQKGRETSREGRKLDRKKLEKAGSGERIINRREEKGRRRKEGRNGKEERKLKQCKGEKNKGRKRKETRKRK